MNRPRLFLLALGCTFCLSAAAQWQWLDRNGHKVFSDRPPPTDVPDNRIMKRPAGMMARPGQPVAAAPEAAAPAARPSGTASGPAGAASGPRLASRDPQLEAKKKQAEQEQQAKAKAADEENKMKRADSCQQARKGMDLLNSGVRLRQTNAKGEPEVMDDAMRAAETRRVQAIIDSDCK